MRVLDSYANWFLSLLYVNNSLGRYDDYSIIQDFSNNNLVS